MSTVIDKRKPAVAACRLRAAIRTRNPMAGMPVIPLVVPLTILGGPNWTWNWAQIACWSVLGLIAAWVAECIRCMVKYGPGRWD